MKLDQVHLACRTQMESQEILETKEFPSILKNLEGGKEEGSALVLSLHYGLGNVIIRTKSFQK